MVEHHNMLLHLTMNGVPRRAGTTLMTNPFANFSVHHEPIVKKHREIPIAFGVPFILASEKVWTWHDTKNHVANCGTVFSCST